MSKVTAYYHIVFCTKRREMTIPLAYKEDLYRFIWKEIKDLKCDLIRIGGIQNHVHILLNLHPTVALATLMQNIKSHSSAWMNSDARFDSFNGWAAEYFACTISPEQKTAVIEYIKGQEQHHLCHAIDDEFKRMYRYVNLPYDERDMI
ncbi:MAG: IS200/IS605 family transposase [Muribaculaceae bacterium]|nr:IS200/IS605 family transposase [Muribaculaceae bacterium]